MPPGVGGSDLSNFILGIDMITNACFGLVFILFIMIIFKFYLKEEKIKFNISNLIGVDLNNSLNYYLIKLIQLNKKTSSVYIFIILVLLLLFLAFDCYFISELYHNLDKFINNHINK